MSRRELWLRLLDEQATGWPREWTAEDRVADDLREVLRLVAAACRLAGEPI